LAKPDGNQSGLKPILEGQWLHVAGLAVLLAGSAWVIRRPEFGMGRLWDIGSVEWFWVAILAAVAHQVYVWLCWRLELHGQRLTRILGDQAFGAFKAGFATLGILRVITVFLVAYANRGSIAEGPLWSKIAAVMALIPALYLFYSVRRYFTFDRAFGADHFDAAVRALPFVRGGIFRFTANGMYTFGFLLLWVPGLWWASAAGLAAALFNHLYIWVHYYATERPDMHRLYGSRP